MNQEKEISVSVKIPESLDNQIRDVYHDERADREYEVRAEIIRLGLAVKRGEYVKLAGKEYETA